MFFARVLVDLPSLETNRKKGFFEWTRSLFGAKIDLRSGFEEVTVSTFSLFEGCFEALRAAGVKDALSCTVDRKAVYVDQNDVKDDLDFVWQALVDRRIVERPWKEIHLILTEESGGLHILFDLRAQSRVKLGSPELSLDLHARPIELRVQSGESAHDFGERVAAFARGADHNAQCWALDQLALRLAMSIRKRLVGAVVSTEPATLRLQKPDARQLGALRNLGFGEDVEETGWRESPSRREQGGDSFSTYYYDPYWTFTSLVMLNSLSHHHPAHGPTIVVVDGQGQELAHGQDISGLQDTGSNAVDWSGDELQVDESVPEVEGNDGWGGSDTGEGQEDGDGWGGSDTHDGDDGWGGSDTGDDGGSSDASDSGGDGGGGDGGGGGE